MIIIIAFDDPGIKDPNDLLNRYHDIPAEMHVHATTRRAYCAPDSLSAASLRPSGRICS